MSGIHCFTEISPRFEFWKTLNNLTRRNLGVFLHWFIYQTNSQCGLRICPAQCWARDPRGAGRHGPCPALPWEERQTNQVPGQLGNGAEMSRERAGGRAGGMREALSPREQGQVPGGGHQSKHRDSECSQVVSCRSELPAEMVFWAGPGELRGP